MKYEVLLSRNENIQAFEEAEQARFLKSFLETLDVPIEYNPDQELTIEDRIRLRQELEKFNLHVINDRAGGLQIRLGQNLIAEWYKATYKLKQDLSEPRPENRIYLEASLSFWTTFEDEKEEEKQTTDEE